MLRLIAIGPTTILSLQLCSSQACVGEMGYSHTVLACSRALLDMCDLMVPLNKHVAVYHTASVHHVGCVFAVFSTYG